MHEYWDVRPPCFYRPSIEGRSVLTQGMSYCMFFVCAVQKKFCWKKINGRKLRTSSRHSCRGFFLFNFFHDSNDFGFCSDPQTLTNPENIYIHQGGRVVAPGPMELDQPVGRPHRHDTGRRSSRPGQGRSQTIQTLPSVAGPLAGAESVGTQGRNGRISGILNTLDEGMPSTISSVGIADNAGRVEPGMDDMLFLFDVFDIELLPPQLARLKHLEITSISTLCHLGSEQASTLDFPPNFFAVLWFLDHRREWLAPEQLLHFPDARTKVRFV